MWNPIVQIKSRNIKINRKIFLIFSYFLCVLIAIIVYISGGTFNVYPNFLYIPIAIIASTNGKKQAVINAAFCGLLMGPFMPLQVDSNIMQEPMNWIIRLMIYITIAFVIGYFADYYKKEFEKNINNQKEIAEEQMATIFALVKLSESRDDFTGAHIERVAILCKLLACELRNLPKYKDLIDNEYIENIFKASPLHDIGKVGIPDSILLKPGKLSPKEFNIIKTHTTIGANTLFELQKRYPNNKFLDIGMNIVHFHHEKWDGTGYPNGLSGEAIPLAARIISIVDVYDALRSKRVYKEAYSHDKSLEIIKEGEGTHFDPILVSTFLENEVEYKAVFEKKDLYEVDLMTSFTV